MQVQDHDNFGVLTEGQFFLGRGPKAIFYQTQ